jgi:hypothetical protein
MNEDHTDLRRSAPGPAVSGRRPARAAAPTRPEARELLSRVWGWEFGDKSTVTVHVRRLREKVERTPARPERIATVWGVGYRYDRMNGHSGQ